MEWKYFESLKARKLGNYYEHAHWINHKKIEPIWWSLQYGFDWKKVGWIGFSYLYDIPEGWAYMRAMAYRDFITTPIAFFGRMRRRLYWHLYRIYFNNIGKHMPMIRIFLGIDPDPHGVHKDKNLYFGFARLHHGGFLFEESIFIKNQILISWYFLLYAYDSLEEILNSGFILVLV